MPVKSIVDKIFHKFKTSILRFLTFCAIFALLTTIFFTFFASETFAADSEVKSMAEDFNPPLHLPAALVFNAVDRPLLLAVNNNVPLEIPGVSRLMTLLISSELLSEDEPITISHYVSTLAAKETNSELQLQANMVLPYRYLIMRMLFNDSDAAAVAIAEHIAGNENLFLPMMQQKASELGMINTEFVTSRIHYADSNTKPPFYFNNPKIDWSNIAYEGYEEVKEQKEEIETKENKTILPTAEDEKVYTAKSSLNDLSLLAQALKANPSAINYLSTPEQLLSVELPNADRVIPIRSNIARLFTLSEGKTEAAYHHRSNRYSLTMSFCTTENNIPIITILVSANQNPMINESLKLYESIEQHYQPTALTEAGAPVPGHSEKTESGESFSLIFLDTVYYVHPKFDYFLKPDVIYLGNAPYVLPIQKGSVSGQIIFEMLDGTKIPVRVGPDRDIISSNTVMTRIVSLLQNNPNLGRLIIGLSIAISVMLLIFFIRELVQIQYWRRIYRMEKNSDPSEYQ